ncbi:MAG: hypothetical protein ACKVII_15660 [Planctomycetales bacterium]|jgi:hypothetical protein
MNPCISSIIAAVLCCVIACSESKAADDLTTTIVPVERWSSLFGGQETTLHFRVLKPKADPAVDGRIQWHYSANQRILDRGEFEISRDDTALAEIKLRIPKVRDGVIFKTEIHVTYVPRGENDAVATLTKSLWLFPEDSFADQRETLKERKLSLFDPAGRTVDLFEKIELPHQRVRNAAALEDRDDHSYVIVGEGTSLIRNRGLAERLLSFAAAGGTVLMLAPSEGVIPMPGEASQKGEPNVAQPGELRFRQHHVIREFDKRLDSQFLPGTNNFAGSKVTLRTRLSRIGMEVSEDGDWPWVTIEYPETNGRFMFCGFRLIKHWENGPTPRYLLNQILQEHQRD